MFFFTIVAHPADFQESHLHTLEHTTRDMKD